jgi:hypothetical protein
VRARILFVLSLTLAGAPSAFASDVGYLYGRVETVDGQTYQGELRWGEEESFWDDMFNADKAENDNLAYLDDRTLDRVRAHHWDGFDFFAFAEPDLKHLFAIRFGDLKRIEVRHGEDAIAEFRDGEEMALHGGSNDIGAVITVVDTKRGRQELRWSHIRTITFEETPAKLDDKLGEPLYGTVHAGKYDFTGRIQWDNDEDLSIDKLDGESSDQKEHIAFGEIASIRKHRSGALVKLKSGDELYLTGTNDVNDENRGIVVNVARIGSIKIGWGDFDEVDFSPAPNTGRGYEEYGKGSNLMGTVVTRDGRYDGRIIFDLDESRDSELLQGMNGHTEYLIPFRDIARIRPEGPHRSVVELRMGLKVELEDGEDVSRKNDGVLVFDGGPKPRYVDWRDVKELVFR